MRLKAVPVLLLIVAGSFGIISCAYAPWSTLGTGYAITSSYHGIDVPLMATVTVTAGTLDPSVMQVTFRWHRPGDTVVREVVVPVFTNGTTGQWNDGTTAPIRYAIDSFRPDLTGDWGVQAFFQDSAGKSACALDSVIKIKATSFNVIPEVPLGTAAILLSMLGALGVFAIKKKRL
jgi:hypothetical protein